MTDFATSLVLLVVCLGALLGWIWLFIGLYGLIKEQRTHKRKMARADDFVHRYNEMLQAHTVVHTAATRKRELRIITGSNGAA